MAFAAMLCWVGVNAQTITINFEQEGNGSPQVEYLNSSFMPTFVDLKAGEAITISDAKYNPKNINGEWISCYQLIMHPNPAGKLLDIQRDGFTDTQAMSDYEVSRVFNIILTEQADQEVNIKFIFDGAEAEVFTHNLVTWITGDGSVQCDYTDIDGVEQSITLSQGDNKLNVMAQNDGGYHLRIYPTASDGLECTYLTVDGYDEYALLEQYEDDGYADIVFYETNVNKNLYVTFAEPPEYDMSINYSVYGSGETDYTYVSDTTGETVEGYMKMGDNIFEDILFDNGYKLNVIPQPAEGFEVTSIIIDDVDDADALAQYKESGSFEIVSEQGHESFYLEIVYEQTEPVETVTHEVKLKANGNIIWQFKHSNVAEQRQDVFTIYDKDTTVVLPDGAFCTWNYSANPDYVVKGLTIDGELWDQYYVSVDRDMEIGIEAVPNEYYSVNVEEPSEGELFVQYANFSIEIGDYEWVDLPRGQQVPTGTDIRVTIYAYDFYAINHIYVNDEAVVTFTAQDDVFKYTYETTVWSDLNVRVDFHYLSSVNDTAADPVEMHVYSVDGRLMKSCMARTPQEAATGLPDGIYIVNGQKVVVND